MKNKFDLKTAANIAAAALLPALLAMPAAADGITDSQIGTGLKNLFGDLSTYLIILSPIVGGTAAVYFITRRAMSDEQDGKLWERRLKTAIVCGVAGTLVGGIIRLIASYF